MIVFICMTGSETRKTKGRRFTEEKDKNFAESIEANAFKTSWKMLTIFRRFDQWRQNIGYYSWARRQSFFCLQLHADEATTMEMIH